MSLTVRGEKLNKNQSLHLAPKTVEWAIYMPEAEVMRKMNLFNSLVVVIMPDPLAEEGWEQRRKSIHFQIK